MDAVPRPSGRSTDIYGHLTRQGLFLLYALRHACPTMSILIVNADLEVLINLVGAATSQAADSLKLFLSSLLEIGKSRKVALLAQARPNPRQTSVPIQNVSMED